MMMYLIIPAVFVPLVLLWLYFRVESVDVEEALQMIENGAVVIDVRTPEEYEEWHLNGAVNINLFSRDFGRKIKELRKDCEYIVYCRSGHRSAVAVRKMRKAGLDAYNLKGGVKKLKTKTILRSERRINRAAEKSKNV